MGRQGQPYSQYKLNKMLAHFGDQKGISKAAGVSQNTVSRAFSKKGLWKPTRDRFDRVYKEIKQRQKLKANKQANAVESTISLQEINQKLDRIIQFQQAILKAWGIST